MSDTTVTFEPDPTPPPAAVKYADVTLPNAPDVTVPAGATYEVHEYMPGQFVWHIRDADGALVDWWNRGQFAAINPDNGEWTLYDRHGRLIKAATFKTELEAHEYAIAAGAVCSTRFQEPHPDPKVEAILAALPPRPVPED